MSLILRRRRREAAAAPPLEEPPPLQTDRVLMALAVHAQQLEDRLAHVEHRLDELASDDVTRAILTEEDLVDVRRHSAWLSSELIRVAGELQAKIDQLAEAMPAVVDEDRRQQRARTLAVTILDLSDSLDTTPVDRHPPPGAPAANV